MGLSGTIVPGTLLAALIQPALNSIIEQPHIGSLNMRFLAPLQVGESANMLVTKRNLDATQLRMVFTDERQNICAIADLKL